MPRKLDQQSARHTVQSNFFGSFLHCTYIQDTCPNNQGSISGECTRIVSEGGGYHANHLFSTETLAQQQRLFDTTTFHQRAPKFSSELRRHPFYILPFFLGSSKDLKGVMPFSKTFANSLSYRPIFSSQLVCCYVPTLFLKLLTDNMIFPRFHQIQGKV